MKKIAGNITAAAVLLFCAALAGCGGGEKDPASEQVLRISITPEATPTPAPEELDPSAVVTNGDITMVNSYLADQTEARDAAENDSGADPGSQEASGEEQ